MSAIAIRYHQVANRVKAVALPAVNWKFLYAMGVGMALALLVVYVWQINALTGGTYLLKDYNKQLDALTKENAALQQKFAQTDFLGSTMSQARELNFEKITEVTYLQILDDSLASAK